MPFLSDLPEAKREDFPLIKYWSQHEWTASDDSQVASIGAPGKARAAQGENISMKFVEDENGDVIDGFKAISIRKFARSLWAGLSKAGRAPKSWGRADAQTSSQFQIEMCQKFPELKLCEGNWKVDLIATITIHHGTATRRKKTENVHPRDLCRIQNEPNQSYQSLTKHRRLRILQSMTRSMTGLCQHLQHQLQWSQMSVHFVYL